MQNDLLVSLSSLSDTELVARLKGLAARERHATAQIVAHLAELDTRDVHLREGYGSLFAYCRDALGLSEAEAFNRIEVARAARRFPVILEMLASAAVHLTTVRLLAPHLTAGNHREVLESARGKRKAEVETIVARLSPRPDVPPSVRKLPAARPDAALLESPPPAPLLPMPAIVALPVTDLAVPALPARPAAVAPLSPGRYKLQLTIGGETLEKLRLAQDMLGHAIPSGDEAAIIDRALTVLVADLAKQKFADTLKPRPSRSAAPGTRQPAAAVKRAVWLRDLGRCAFVGTSGHRCNERRFLEFHHLDPYVLGGESSVDRIALRCRRHNDYEGRLYFGKRRSADGSARVREETASYGSQRSSLEHLFRNESRPTSRAAAAPSNMATNT